MTRPWAWSNYAMTPKLIAIAVGIIAAILSINAEMYHGIFIGIWTCLNTTLWSVASHSSSWWTEHFEHIVQVNLFAISPA